MYVATEIWNNKEFWKNDKQLDLEHVDLAIGVEI